MRDVQPTAIDDNATVDVVLGYSRFMYVVGLEDHLAIAQLPRPRIVCCDAILRQRRPNQQRRVPERAAAARAGFGISPRAVEDFAARFRRRAAAVEEQRQDVDRKSTRL